MAQVIELSVEEGGRGGQWRLAVDGGGHVDSLTRSSARPTGGLGGVRRAPLLPPTQSAAAHSPVRPPTRRPRRCESGASAPPCAAKIQAAAEEGGATRRAAGVVPPPTLRAPNGEERTTAGTHVAAVEVPPYCHHDHRRRSQAEYRAIRQRLGGQQPRRQFGVWQRLPKERARRLVHGCPRRLQRRDGGSPTRCRRCAGLLARARRTDATPKPQRHAARKARDAEP